jgi:hypothetical protein
MVSEYVCADGFVQKYGYSIGRPSPGPLRLVRLNVSPHLLLDTGGLYQGTP